MFQAATRAILAIVTTVEFLKYLAAQVDAYKMGWHIGDDAALMMWYAIESMGLDEPDAYEAVSIGSTSDAQVDFFLVDHETERVVIGAGCYESRAQSKASLQDIKSLLALAEILKEPAKLRSQKQQDLEGAALDFVDAVNKGYSLEFLYVQSGDQVPAISDFARKFNLEEAGSVPSRYLRVANLRELVTLREETISQTTRIKSAVVNLASGTIEERGDFGVAVVATVSGDELRKLYAHHGDSLFDRNVRLFLGARKGGVNAGIRDTLGSPGERPNFWAYNNGVTFICDSYSVKDHRVSLRNFSIVNGCQTTVTVASVPASAAREIRVLARFIAAPETVVDSIIRFTNSQNPIRVWDLTAQDRLQRKLKKELAKLKSPYFYVLRKGEMGVLKPSERAKFRWGGKFQAITYDTNAQYLAAFKGLPAIAYKEKGQVFSAHLDTVFPDDIRPAEVVFVWRAGRTARELASSQLATAAAGEDEARVAILKRGAAFFTLSVMAILLHERNGTAFLDNLSAETASASLVQRKLKNYATVALEWYVEAMDDLVSSGEDVAALVRSQDGWLRVRPRIYSKWRIFSLNKKLLEGTLPKI